jgi:hypothetical protein
MSGAWGTKILQVLLSFLKIYGKAFDKTALTHLSFLKRIKCLPRIYSFGRLEIGFVLFSQILVTVANLFAGIY